MMMIRFVKNRFGPRAETEQRFALGHLERNVMDILWSRGTASVRDVAQGLDRHLAYTTVMTTLDRLFKKNFLTRSKSDRAYLYSPRVSRAEWERRRAGDLVAGFLAGPQPARELLLSCLLDAVGEYDAVLLDALEKKIKSKRKELCRRGQP
jgi:predicted transcriptional regulator